MNITIDLNDEQVKFLKQFAANQHEGATDNLCTRKPLHLVQTEELIYMHDGGCNGDYAVYINTDDCEKEFKNERDIVLEYGQYDDPDDVIDYETAFASNSLNGEIICDINDYFKAYGIESEIECCSVVKTYRTVAYFFILENAKDYIKYQGHNLKNPRTFTVDCGYSNRGEYESFFDLLMSIGQHLNQIDPPVIPVKKHQITRTITRERADFINNLLNLTGDEIYDKYGMKRDETITETVVFDDGIEMDIKLVICEDEDMPYTEAVLFKDGCELICTDVEDEFVCEWELTYETDNSIDEYTVNIIVENE